MLEIVVGAVGDAREFDPVTINLGLSVPAVLGVVSEFVVAVLAKSEFRWRDADRGQPFASDAEIVANPRRRNHALCDGLPDRCLDILRLGGMRVFDLLLAVDRVESQIHVFDPVYRWVIVGCVERLEFGHCQLAQADDCLPGADLVSVAAADLGDAEGRFLVGVFGEPREFDQRTLGGFGPKIACATLVGTNRRLEHQVKFLHRTIGERCAAVRTGQVVRGDQALDLLRREMLGVGDVSVILDEVIRPMSVVTDSARYQEVVEGVEVTRGSED